MLHDLYSFRVVAGSPSQMSNATKTDVERNEKHKHRGQILGRCLGSLASVICDETPEAPFCDTSLLYSMLQIALRHRTAQKQSHCSVGHK